MEVYLVRSRKIIDVLCGMRIPQLEVRFEGHLL